MLDLVNTKLMLVTWNQQWLPWILI